MILVKGYIMGLDMYAYAIDKEIVGDREIDFSLGYGSQNSLFSSECEYDDVVALGGLRRLKYWRKFNHLHGWMHRLYNKKGGTGEFNCVGLCLNEEDLKLLKEDAENLEPTSGFFFGAIYPIEPEEVDDIRNFVEMALEEIKNGKVVVYDSWW